jgi:hypothetical protein
MITETTTTEPTNGRAGAPLGNRNREKHRGRARVVLGEAPSGYGHVYRGVRELLKELKAEFVAKFGAITVSQEELLDSAGQWLVRSRCWHKYARTAELTDLARNESLDKEVECHERYANRLKSIGLGKCADGNTNANDPFAALDAELAESTSDPACANPGEASD